MFPAANNLSRAPWWALIATLIGALFLWVIVTDETYGTIFSLVSEGIFITVFVTVLSYAIALVLGLLLAFGRVSTNFFAEHISSQVIAAGVELRADLQRFVADKVLLGTEAFFVNPHQEFLYHGQI